MQCSTCNQENRDGAKFCDNCGNPLAPACSNCGQELRTTARFCDECGTPVEPTAPPAPEQDGSPAEAVRKTVTVLFCDLVGSTAFTEQVDAEAAREAMARYHAMARSAVEDHGGTVVKFIGDGVMAMWGVPEVTEDDARRAVACGLGLQDGFAAVASHVAERYGVDVGLRVGINTGEVVIAAGDDDIIGDALNTAARLEAACTPGDVLVGEQTWRLTRTALVYEALGTIDVKGKAEPIATFRAIGAAADEVTTAPFVGREEQLGRLRTAFETAVTDRSVRLAIVIGSPGVGKTRLAAELIDSCSDVAATFDIRCEQAGTSPFAPIRDLLLSITGIDADAEHDRILDALSDVVDPITPDGERLVELLGSFLGATETRSTEESFYAVRRLLELLGARRPIIVVVDDIQWAEPMFLDLLEHLAEWVSGSSVLIVGLARPELRSQRPTLSEPGRRVSTVVSLEGLDPDATAQLAISLLGATELSPELVSRLPSSTEGNPLFVREFVRMLADDGVIVRSGNTFELTIDAEAVEVPPTIQSLLATRVERLPPDERHIIELASVVGPEFPRGALKALTVETPDELISEIIERLRRKELVDPTGTYWGDEPVLRFHHVLIREAAYRRLLKDRRADLHAAVGRWTEATASAAIGHHEATIAFHFEHAHRYRAELGPLDDETRSMGVHAADLLQTAATRALEQDDLSTAGSLATRAIDIVEADDRKRAGLLLLACEALASSGDIVAARPVVDSLRQAADTPRLAAWATCFESQLILLTDPRGLSTTLEDTEEAARALAAIGDDAGVAKARQIRAGALARLGRVGDSEVELDLALNAARSAEDRRRVAAVLGVAPLAALWGPSTVPRAGGRCLDVVRLLRITSGSPAVEAISVRCQAVLDALRGRFDSAREMLATSRATAEELGLRQGLFETELFSGFVELLAEEPEAAEPYLRTARAGLGKMGIGADAGQASAYLARSLLLQGRLEEAESLAVDADGLAGQNLQTSIAAKSVRAEILAALGRLDLAVELATEAVTIAGGTDIVVDHALASAALARVQMAAGNRAAADEANRKVVELSSIKEADALRPAARRSGGLTGGRADGDASTPGDRADDRQAPLASSDAEWLDAVGQRDLARLRQSLSAGFIHRDHRARASGPPVADRDGYVQAIRELLASCPGEIEIRAEEISRRTEYLDLAAITVRSDGQEVERLLVLTAIDEAGRYERFDFFDPDEVDDATMELERHANDHLLTRLEEPMRSIVAAIFSSYAERDLDGFAAILDPAFVFDDRRSGPRFERSRDVHLGMVQALFDEGGRFVVSVRPFRSRGGRLLAAQATIFRKAGARTDFIMLISIGSNGLVERFTTFDPQDHDAAMAELERVAALSEPSVDVDGRDNNRPRPAELDAPGRRGAAAAMARMFARMSAGDMAGAVTCLSPHVTQEDRRHGFSLGATDLDGLVELMTSVVNTDQGPVRLEPEVIEERGDVVLSHLSIIRHNSFVSEMLHLSKVDDAGLVTRTTLFDVSALADARAELDRQAGGHGAPTVPETRAVLVVDEMLRTSDEDILDRFDDLVAPGMVRDDRRPGLSDITDRDGFRAAMAAFFELGGRQENVHHLAVRGSHLILSRYQHRYGSDNRSQVLVINQIQSDDRLVRSVIFTPSQKADANAELDRLFAEERRARPSTDNTATALLRELLERASPDDLSVYEELVSPDVVREDRRTGVADGVMVGLGAMLEMTRSVFAVGMRYLPPSVIEQRGERLVLARAEMANPAGDRVLLLGIVRSNDRRQLDLLIFFDEDDLESASHELDRLGAELRSAPSSRPLDLP